MDKYHTHYDAKFVKHIFIIGSKSIGQYGGYETFVDKITEQHQYESRIKYHIACKANGDGFMDEKKLSGIEIIKKNKNGAVMEFTYHNAHVFKIQCPKIGPAVAIYYDWAAFKYCINYCKTHHIESPVFYVLTCRIGLFINSLSKQLKEIGGLYFLNPDGHEWKRQKWNYVVRKYWKWSEKKMVKTADFVVCDSMNIEKYIKQTYKHPNTTFIAYGSDTEPSSLLDNDPTFDYWLREKGLTIDGYYLIVGRFVPENNYETMIREFMRSQTMRSLVVITNKNEKLRDHLESILHFSNDSRIKFVGTVYDKELLKKIRESAYGYIHGHEVGGTNPSLLEALGSTDINMLLDVGFNKEVGLDSALYWNKDNGNLASLINRVDNLNVEERKTFGKKAKERVKSAYSWDYIANEYKKLWMN